MKKSFYKLVITCLVALMFLGFLPYTQAVSTTTVEAATKERQVTGKGKTLWFHKGDTVFGYKIVINGKIYINKIIKNAPYKGKVTDGVINPWTSEIKGKKVVKNSEIIAVTPTPKPTATPKPTVKPTVTPTPKPTATPTPAPIRVETGVNGQKDFKVGESASGKLIIINGKPYTDSYILNSPYSGTVYNGVINPWEGEYKSLTKIVIAPIPTPTITPTPTPVSKNTVINEGQTYTTKSGDSVAAKLVVYNNVNYPNTYIANTPAGCIVYGYGLINPTPDKLNGYTIAIVAPTPTPTPSPVPTAPVRRATTTSSDILYFSKGESVYAADIYVLDQSGSYYQHFQNTWIINCPNSGYLYKGYVNPYTSDIPKGVHIYIY